MRESLLTPKRGIIPKQECTKCVLVYSCTDDVVILAVVRQNPEAMSSGYARSQRKVGHLKACHEDGESIPIVLLSHSSLECVRRLLSYLCC